MEYYTINKKEQLIQIDESPKQVEQIQSNIKECRPSCYLFKIHEQAKLTYNKRRNIADLFE